VQTLACGHTYGVHYARGYARSAVQGALDHVQRIAGDAGALDRYHAASAAECLAAAADVLNADCPECAANARPAWHAALPTCAAAGDVPRPCGCAS